MLINLSMQIFLRYLLGFNLYIFCMILQQNYIRIAQYSQKTVKIYCRRAFGMAIIRLLKKKNIKQRERSPHEIDDSFKNQNKLISQKSIALCSGIYEESDKADSMVSQLKKSVHLEKYDRNNPSIMARQNFRIHYGDIVKICSWNEEADSKMRVKCLMGKIVAEQIEKNYIEFESDSSCLFQIVRPSIGHQNIRTPITNESLVSFRNVVKNQFVSTMNKINIGEEFGMRLTLTKIIDAKCIFRLQNKNGCAVAHTGNKMHIREVSMEKFLCVNEKRYENELQISETPTNFIIYRQPLSNKSHGPFSRFFYIQNCHFSAYLKAQQIDKDNVFTYRTYPNAFSSNQVGIITKITPILSISYNLRKTLQKNIEITSILDDYCVWQLIRDKNNYGAYIIYSPLAKIGLALKLSNNNKVVTRLTSNRNEFTRFYIQAFRDQIALFSQNRCNVMHIVQQRQDNSLKLKVDASEQSKKSKGFKLIKVPQKIENLIRQLLEMFEGLLVCFEFFNEWGIFYDKKSDAIYYSVKQIKLSSAQLLIKIKEVSTIFKKLSTYFAHHPHIQETIRTTQIFNLIIELCKLLMQKIWPETLSENNEQSPFFYAKSNIEELLLEGLEIILKITANHKINSDLIISEASFFNRLLLHYPEYVGVIIQEAIKNLTLFSVQNSLGNFNQIFLWVKLIEPVKEETILIQKTYIDIISEVVVDPNDKGIISYQNKCKELIFIQGPSKRKAIPKFGFHEDLKKSFIVFERESCKQEFLEKNPLLQKINVLEDQPTTFFIQSFYVEKHNPFKSVYDSYIKYICSIIRLFRNLSKDRNKKLIKMISDWGISHDHIFFILLNRKITWELKSIYLDLYIKIYVDQDPFLTFEKRESICHCWDKIKNYNVLERTCMIFRQYTNEGLAYNRLNQHSFKLTLILNSFFTDFYHKGSSFIYQKIEIESFLRILKIVYQTLNFGFFTIKEAKQYICIMLTILTSVKSRQNFKRIISPEIKKLTVQIISIVIKILSIYEQIWIEIYGLSFLQKFCLKYADKAFNMSWDAYEEEWLDILMNTFEDPLDSIVLNKDLQRKKTKAQLYTENLDSTDNYPNSGFRFTTLLKITNDKKYEEIDEEVTQFLIELMCQNYYRFYEFNPLEVSNLLQKKLQRNQQICRYLKNIMILNNPQEEEVYKNFNGRQPNKLLNWLKIQELVNKIKECESSKFIESENQKRKKQKILQLNNTLVKIIREINNYKNQSYVLFKKSQQILEKLNVHACLLEILNFSEKKIYKEVLLTIFIFFQLFIQNNQANSRVLSQNLPQLSLKINFQIYVKLIPSLFIYSPDQTQVITNLINCFKRKKQQYNKYILQIIYKLLNLKLNQESQAFLKKELINTFISDIDIKKLTHKEYSTQYLKVACKLSENSSDLFKRIKSDFTKEELISRIVQCEQYEDKRFYIFIMRKIIIEGEDIENFEIEDLIINVAMPQIKKIPNLCLRMIDNPSFSHSIESKISELLHELTDLSIKPKIKASSQEAFLKYLFDNEENSESPSLLTLINFVTKKWDHHKKSKKLLETQQYISNLEKYLEYVFYEKNSKFYQQILFEIQKLSISLKRIVANTNQLGSNRALSAQILDTEEKSNIIEFYYSLGELLVQQRISISQVLELFGAEAQKLSSKRTGDNVSQQITEQQFMNSFEGLSKLVKNEKQLKKIVQNCQLFRFINYYKDQESKLLDIYPFLERLASVLEYLRNVTIHNQVNKIYDNNLIPEKKEKEYSMEMLEDIEEYYRLDMNQYTESSSTREIQLSNQIETFCKVAKQSPLISNLKQRQLNKMIERSIDENPNPPLVNEWAASIQQYIFLHEANNFHNFLFKMIKCLIRHIEVGQMNGQVIENFSNIFRVFLQRFNQSPCLQYLQLLKTFIETIVVSSQTISMSEQIILESSKILMKQIELHLMNPPPNLIRSLKYLQSIYEKFLLNQEISFNFKVISKENIFTHVLLLIKSYRQHDRQVQSICITEILQILLTIWSHFDQISEYDLFLNQKFNQWINYLLASAQFSRITNRNTTDLMYTKILHKISMIYTNYYQKYPSAQLNLKLIDFSSVKQISYPLLNEVLWKKQKIYSEEDYCSGREECNQLFCNSNKINPYDLFIIEIILQLFILIRLKEAYEQRVSRKKVTNQLCAFGQLIITITINWGPKKQSFNFKKPYLSHHLDSNIKQHILMEVWDIGLQNLEQYLPALSYLLEKLLIQNGKMSRYSIFKLLINYKHFLNLLLFLGNLASYLAYLYRNELIPLYERLEILPLFIFTIIIASIELYFFHLKLKHFSSLKYRTSAFKLPSEESDLPLSNKILIILKELWKSQNYLYPVAIIIYLLCFFNEKFTILLGLIHFFLFSKVREDIFCFFYGGFCCLFNGLVFLVISIVILSLIFYIREGQLSILGEQTFLSYLKTVFEETYSVAINSFYVSEDSNLVIFSRNIVLLILVQVIIFVLFFCILYFSLMFALSYKQSERQRKNQCWVCGKKREEMMEDMELKEHVDGQHNFWNYLFYYQVIKESGGKDKGYSCLPMLNDAL